MEKKTIEQIIAIEPKLQRVIDMAKNPARKTFDWGNSYHECKMVFQNLVGWFAEKQELQNHIDYETFVMFIVDIIYENSAPDNDDNEIEEEV